MTRTISVLSLVILLASFEYVDRLLNTQPTSNVLMVALCITFTLCIVGLSAAAWGVARGAVK